MREGEGGAFLEIRLYLLLVHVRLLHVRNQDMDYVSLPHGVGDGHHFVALALGLGPALPPFSEPHDDLEPRVAEVARLGRSLDPVADDRDRLPLYRLQTHIVIVPHLRHTFRRHRPTTRYKFGRTLIFGLL